MSPRSIAILGAPLAAVTVVIVVVLLLVGIGPVWLAIVLPLVLAAAVAGYLYTRADAIVSRSVGAQAVDAKSQPRFANLVEELCVRAGLDVPSLHLVDSESVNAMAFGANPAASSIAVTSGALKRLSLVQLEGLLAREVGRLRNGNTRMDTLAVPFIRQLLGPFGSLGTKLMHMLRGDDGEPSMDLAGMELTRYPPGLIEAFVTMKEAGDPASAQGPTSHLWTRGPDAASVWSIDDRIALLREL